MTKISRILHWIQVTADEVQRETDEQWVFSTKETRKRFNRWPKGTITSALSRLYKQGLIERVERGLYKILSVYYEHFVSTVLYCGSHHETREVWYAITHAPFGGSIDPYNDLSDQMMEELIEKRKGCYKSEEDDDQYTNSKQVKLPNPKFTFPYIEIGKLNKRFQKTRVWRVKLE